MLPKALRLRARDIERLSSGKSVFGTLLSMRYVRSDRAGFSVSVSKKVAPRAVDRNRIRRRLYAALRACNPGSLPVFVMVLPKKECLAASLPELSSELSSLISRAGLAR